MKRIVFFTALLLFAARTFAVNFTISDIRLEGLQRVSASPVFAAMPIQVGDTVDSEDLRATIRSLFKTGFFTNVQIARDNDVLILILQERPAIKSINIEGNKAIKTEQLTDVMNDADLREGEILQRHTLQGIARELERQYVGRGRYGASVETEVTELPNNMVSIDIQVDEGNAAKIKHINIVGNEQFSDKELVGLFELGTTKWNSFFSSSDQYAKEKLTGDIETLESYYLDRGYLDFKVLSTQVSISPDKKAVFITLNISEGDIYKVDSIELAGELILPEDRIKRLVLLKEGDTFSQERMTSTSEYITTLLGNIGYTNAKVDGIPRKNDDKGSVDLSFFIDPGKRVYVRRIEFRGNVRTGDEVLRREMRQIEGASASNARIEQSKVRLERLGFFKEVKVDTKDVPGTTDLVDVEYTVEEQASGTISATVGYAQTTGINLGVNVQQKNWLGTGKQVDFGINKNFYQTQYLFTYNDPYFTPDGVSRGFSAYYRTRDYDRINVSSYSTDSYGLNVRFGYPISEISRLSFGLGFMNQSVKTGAFAPQEIRSSPSIQNSIIRDLTYITQSDYEEFISDNLGTNAGVPRDEFGLPTEFQLPSYLITEDNLFDTEPGFIDIYGDEFNSLTMNLSWSRFTLNRGILATRGNAQQLSFEATAPGSELEYYKITYDAQAFQPLTRDLTLRFKTSLGYGSGYGDMEELPFFENFFAGGFGSVRGFERSTLGPKGSPPITYMSTHTGWEDIDFDGVVDGGAEYGASRNSFVLCEDPTSTKNIGSSSSTSTFANRFCEPGKLVAQRVGFNFNSFGGNILVEFSTELILPIPFIEDTRSMQLVAFVDAGNVFSDYCRDSQINCSSVDLSKLSSSAGFGFTWISGMGPLTFSIAKTLNKNDLDEREFFQFSFGAGF